jgi:hypothetical protein
LAQPGAVVRGYGGKLRRHDFDPEDLARQLIGAAAHP